jgi:hypothetical protein
MTVLKYIELKSAQNGRGPAWIARVQLSKSKTTIYFNGRALCRSKGSGVAGNYFDIETGDEYWISGPKKNGADRHWAGSGRILVEAAALTEYLNFRAIHALDASAFAVTDTITSTNIQMLSRVQNNSLKGTNGETDA